MNGSSTLKICSSDNEKKRIAHRGATTSGVSLKDLEHKKESIAQSVGSSSARQRSPVSKCTQKQQTLAQYLTKTSPKRRKLVSKGYNSTYDREEEEDETERMRGEDVDEGLSRSSSESDDDDDLVMGGDAEDQDEDRWISKTTKNSKMNGRGGRATAQQPSRSSSSSSSESKLEGTSAATAQRHLKLPPPPSIDFQVRQRAVLLSSDEEGDDSDGMSSKSKSTSARESRKPILMSEEEDETDWMKKNQPNTAGPSDVERKKKRAKKPEAEGMLKALKCKAEKLKEKQKKKRGKGRTRSDDEEAADSDGSSNDNEEVRADSFDSDDSDAGERMSARQLKLMRALEQKCVDFLNDSDEAELKACEKFNDRFVAFVLNNRPFISFNDLKAKAVAANSVSGRKGTGAGAFARLLDGYMEWSQNRGILDKVLDDCRQHSKAIEKALDGGEGCSLVVSPPGLNPNCSLHPYQLVGLNWLILMSRLGMNAILADEMGLGKTIQVIAFLAWAKDQQEAEPRLRGPHLIVVPSSTIENWMQEIGRWAPSLRVLTYYGSIDARMHLRHSARKHAVDVVLSTYNMVISRPEDRKFFKKFSLNYVIYDEGHMLRNCASQRYTNLMKVHGKRKILLTGTPLQNNLIELISLMYFTMRKLFDKYCDNIASLLQMFATRGKVLMEKTHQKGRAKKATKDEANEREEDGEVQEEPSGLYEKHKIAQAKNILQPFILRRLKTEVLRTESKLNFTKIC
uniref:Helicase ATP-binding domain-containing protein n=1 Tax=Globodera pallida TaxID=36090 RepID=A0A183BST6_GLOPA